MVIFRGCLVKLLKDLGSWEKERERTRIEFCVEIIVCLLLKYRNMSPDRRGFGLVLT